MGDGQPRSSPLHRSLRPVNVNFERLQLQPRVRPLQRLSRSLLVDILGALCLVSKNADPVGEDFYRAAIDREVLHGIPLGGQGEHSGPQFRQQRGMPRQHAQVSRRKGKLHANRRTAQDQPVGNGDFNLQGLRWHVNYVAASSRPRS